MLNYTGDADFNSTATTYNKFVIPREIFAALYVLGIVGSVSALLHLFRKQKFKNTKQVFLLKCLMMLDFVGMMGMLSQMTIRYHVTSESFHYEDHSKFFCFVRIVWRFLGYSSGSVAFIMAIDRYISLTRPFFYCQHFTNGFIRKLVFMFCLYCAATCFAPAFGIGIYHDDIFYAKNCKRNLEAEDEKPIDVAFSLFSFFLGTLFLFLMVLCNFSVTRIVNRSHRNMEQLTMNFLKVKDSLNQNQQPIKPCHKNNAVTRCNTTSKSISFVTSDEIIFVNMCNLLTISFVICWEAQIIIIPIGQFVKNANQSKFIHIYYQFADLLLLFHFTMDPYIYVLLRTNYWTRLKIFLSQLLFKEDDEFAAIPKLDQ